MGWPNTTRGKEKPFSETSFSPFLRYFYLLPSPKWAGPIRRAGRRNLLARHPPRSLNAINSLHDVEYWTDVRCPAACPFGPRRCSPPALPSGGSATAPACDAGPTGASRDPCLLACSRLSSACCLLWRIAILDWVGVRWQLHRALRLNANN